MAKISKERLEQYRQMASRDLWDIDHKGFNQFFTRAREEGVELISNNFSNLGMFRSPHHKRLDEIDLAIVGVPWIWESPTRGRERAWAPKRFDSGPKTAIW